jgi:hypothetical protein
VATREQILDALLILLTSVAPTPFRTARRQWAPWPEDQPFPVEQPAIFLLCPSNQYTQGGGGPKRILNCEAWVFAKPPLASTQPGDVNRTAPGERYLNDLLDSLDAAFDSSLDPIRGRSTLGNRVHRVWIEGTVQIEPGDLQNDGQCFMAVPINVLLP